MAGLIRAAVIRNPRSSRNARAGAPPRVVATSLGLRLAEPSTSEELESILGEFRTDGVELVTVDGGDGTVREVLSALARMAWAPRLAVLPSGKINLIAGDVGLRRGGGDGLRAIAALTRRGWDDLRIERRPTLRLDRAGASPVFGMFAGAAAFAEACRLAERHLHPRGLESGPAVAAGIVAALGRTAAGKLGDGEPMTVAMDNDQPVNGRHFLLLATTLERLALNLWPFWSEGSGSLHVLDVTAPPRALPRALLPLLLGWARPWMRQAGYRSRNADAVELRLTAPVILDGEAFAPGADGRIRLAAGPVAEFVRP